MSTERQNLGDLSKGVATAYDPPLAPHTSIPIADTELTARDYLRGILEAQGISFIAQARPAEIPVINMIKLEDRVVGIGNGEKASRIIGALTWYLETPAVVDSWGENHDGRRQWKSSMLREHGDVFRELYENNQIRVNHITPVYEGVTTLANLIPGERKFTPIHRQLKYIKDYLKPVTDEFIDQSGQRFPKGEAYNRMSNQEKVKLVQGLEDHIVALLHTLAKGNSSPSKQPRLILMT